LHAQYDAKHAPAVIANTWLQMRRIPGIMGNLGMSFMMMEMFLAPPQAPSMNQSPTPQQYKEAEQCESATALKTEAARHN
jgi:hypothetical protein